MEFITVEEYKAFEGLKSPEGDAQIGAVVRGANALVSNILGLTNLTDYVYKPSSYPLTVWLDTEAKASDITVTDEEGNALGTLTGMKGHYTFTNEEYIGIVNFAFPSRFTVIPEDLKLAVLYLVRYFRSNEYKASMSGAGQSVTFVSLTSNIPKHIMSILSLYRPL